MALIFKRRAFARWQASERLPDAAFCLAVREMQEGLVDADLGALRTGVLLEVNCEQDH